MPSKPFDALPTDLPGETIEERAAAILQERDPVAKARATVTAAAAWADGTVIFGEKDVALPDRPGRLERPELRLPAEMPRRRAGGRKGRIALLHALAHIELNAINLAWDMVARFGPSVGEEAFISDWVSVAGDEGRHFLMLEKRLGSLDAAYGDLPAHDGLWEAAEATSHDLLARLAVVPMVLEARGLDVCPGMIAKLKEAGDEESAALLQVIYEEEINHVHSGWVWFRRICAVNELPLKETWQALVRKHFRGTLKSPFNEVARDQAGFPREFYGPLAKG